MLRENVAHCTNRCSVLILLKSFVSPLLEQNKIIRATGSCVLETLTVIFSIHLFRRTLRREAASFLLLTERFDCFSDIYLEKLEPSQHDN